MFTICYLTNRRNPRFDWFADSLLLQLNRYEELYKGALPQVVVIDSQLWHPPFEQRMAMVHKLRQHLHVTHLPPKPCIWQGPHRLTQRDYFAAANARNTAACVANYNYLVFVDDLSVLTGNWLNEAGHAATHNYVVCGAYKKVRNLQVENGEVKHCDEFEHGIDSRWGIGSNEGMRPIGGGQMFGCSFGVPLEDYLNVNGQDEICDAIGGEDYNFGIRLEKAGRKIWYNRNMLTLESEEAHHEEHPFIRIDKKTPDNPDGHDSSNVILNRTLKGGMWTQGNHFMLRQTRETVKSLQGFPTPKAPTTHWPDGQPLSEM